MEVTKDFVYNRGQMELHIGDYGKLLFQVFAGSPPGQKDSGHWESIRQEATPLIQQLIDLNSKMKGGYRLYGHYVDGKKKLNDHQLILMAQKASWQTIAKNLKVGDLVWLLENDMFEMQVGEHDPVVVKHISDDSIIVKGDRYHPLIELHPNEKVLKAPDNLDELDYESDEFWLNTAKELDL